MTIGNDEAMADQFRERARIAVAHRLETPLESGMEARKQAGRSRIRRAVVLALEQQADDDRRQRPRQAVGRQHREHHRKPERREQILCRSVEEHHRGKDATDGQRRHQCRNGDAGGAVQCRLRQRLPLLGKQSMGVLDRDGRIVRPECRPPAQGRRASWCSGSRRGNTARPARSGSKAESRS